MKRCVLEVLGSLTLTVAMLGACSSTDHELGASQAELGGESDHPTCESEGGQCVAYEYTGCLDGTWGGAEEFPCGEGAACCFDMPGPQAPCDFVGGTCIEYSPTGCTGRWLPANTRPCDGSPEIGCCVGGE